LFNDGPKPARKHLTAKVARPLAGHSPTLSNSICSRPGSLLQGQQQAVQQRAAQATQNQRSEPDRRFNHGHGVRCGLGQRSLNRYHRRGQCGGGRGRMQPHAQADAPDASPGGAYHQSVGHLPGKRQKHGSSGRNMRQKIHSDAEARQQNVDQSAGQQGEQKHAQQIEKHTRPARTEHGQHAAAAPSPVTRAASPHS